MLAVTFSGGDKMLRSIVSAPACTPGPWPITLRPILCSAASSLADLRLGGHCWRAELRLGIIWEMVFISKILTYKLILCTVRGLLSVTLMTDFFEVPFFGRIWAWLLFVGLKNRPVVFQPLCKPCAFWCLLTPGHLCSQEPAVVVSLGRAGEGAGQDKESGPSFGPRESSSLGPQQTRAWSERESGALSSGSLYRVQGLVPVPGWPSFIPGLHAKSLALLQSSLRPCRPGGNGGNKGEGPAWPELGCSQGIRFPGPVGGLLLRQIPFPKLKFCFASK